ncbi:hypothetical protein [Chondromyces crocatus]|uniref:Outer membrane protein beta-barrel domain-containing protein n=1 Tax=Chondromyces crocatus TaxID=52 RepID=A0A0K1E9S8_CHOCO|nr:hypothetical protein [Chondromyces crocatus]AKT37594.1 uncharacterized protein CMC5_017350 [Chondromyces crocatus]
MRHVAIAAAVTATLVFATSSARADIVIGAEGDLAIPVGSSADPYSVGWGIMGRLGYAVRLRPIEITPEVGGGYYAFPIEVQNISLDTSGVPHVASVTRETAGLVRAFAGGRVALDKKISPAAYVRVGMGYLSVPRGDAFAPTLGGGLALDIRALPLVNFGIHVGYEKMLREDEPRVPSLQWLALGAQAAIQF